MADVATVTFSGSSAETIENAKAFWKSIDPPPEQKSTLAVSGINHRLKTAPNVPNGWLKQALITGLVFDSIFFRYKLKTCRLTVLLSYNFLGQGLTDGYQIQTDFFEMENDPSKCVSVTTKIIFLYPINCTCSVCYTTVLDTYT